ncbi:MAG: GNAT family N-acetyltransferase [Clostridia bacterium]|nr:GNAT family N-acetyltransferase [Clostridia bacterium]
MNNQTLLETAMAQSALEFGCAPGDFLADENKVVLSGNPDGARAYLQLPFTCQLVSYGRNVVASTSPELQEVARGYINRFPAEHCFETPNLHVLDDALASYGQRTCFMAEYFLPDLRRLIPLNCPYPMRTLEKPDFAGLYLPEWSNALCADRAACDALCVGAYHGGELIALAGASADCEDMWQIGIDVLPAYRRQGVAAALTSRLACEIIARGKVPFYCAAWSNIGSVRNAIRAGFRPAWVELTAKPTEYVNGRNQ